MHKTFSIFFPLNYLASDESTASSSSSSWYSGAPVLSRKRKLNFTFREIEYHAENKTLFMCCYLKTQTMPTWYYTLGWEVRDGDPDTTPDYDQLERGIEICYRHDFLCYCISPSKKHMCQQCAFVICNKAIPLRCIYCKFHKNKCTYPLCPGKIRRLVHLTYLPSSSAAF